MPYDNENPFSPFPRRRRDDAELGERLSAVEAAQEEHRFLIERVTTVIESLARIETINAHNTQMLVDHDKALQKINNELPSFRLARFLVFASVLSIMSTAALLVYKSHVEIADKSASGFERPANGIGR